MPREAQRVLKPTRGQLKPSDIESITTPGKYRHYEIRQLSLYVQGDSGAPTSASWVFKYSSPTQFKAGKRVARTKGFGRYDSGQISVVERRAREWAALLTQGEDPSDEQDRAKEASKAKAAVNAFSDKTLAEVFEMYMDHKRGGWSKRASGGIPISEKNWRQSFNYAADFSAVRFGDLSYQTVVDSIESIWNRDKTDAANRYFKRMRDVIRWWCRKNNQLRNELNVCLPEKIDEFEFKHQNIGRKSYPSIPWDQMPDFWSRLNLLQVSEGVVALKLAVLTGSRPVEMRELRWSQVKTNKNTGGYIEISPNKETGEVTKTGDVYRFPITAEIQELIDYAKENFGPSDTWVLPSPNHATKDKPLSEGAARQILAKVGYKGQATVHGFRTTLKTFAIEKLSVQPYVAESLLQHKIVGNYFQPLDIWNEKLKVYAAYHRWLVGGQDAT